MTLTLPFPPSVNHYWKRTGRGMRLSDRGKSYRAAVVAGIWNEHGAMKPMTGRLKVCLLFQAPDRRRRDLDNFLKGPLDALAYAGVYEDDSQIDRIEIERGERVEGGSLVVEVKEIEVKKTRKAK